MEKKTALQTMNILTREIHSENDVVSVRGQARQIASSLGFDEQDQTRIATSVSEIARNAFQYAGEGKVEYLVEGVNQPQGLVIQISDHGAGITDVSAVLEGRCKPRKGEDGRGQSFSGLGLGIIGAKRLMDALDIDSIPGSGTNVCLKKIIPPRIPVITTGDIRRIVGELQRIPAQSVFEELQQQNQELLGAMGSLNHRQEELLQLNREMEETNRGVMALYTELDEKSQRLKEAYDQKSAFLANMGHELRTPLNSIISLSRLILDRVDGELTAEQEKQVGFIRKAAEDLSTLINDLLDLAKIEAGKLVVKPVMFEVASLFGSLRGLFRPLLTSASVSLIFEEPHDLLSLYTDEGKVAQILRNIISNALKYTEKGEVRISVALTPERQAVIFSVADTGIGIDPQDQEWIFQPFNQVDHLLQKDFKGTGLGLPLSRTLAELLGGGILLKSTPGSGSIFSAVIPINYGERIQVISDDRVKSRESMTIPEIYPGEKRVGVPDRRTKARRIIVHDRRRGDLRIGALSGSGGVESSGRREEPGNDIKAKKILIIDDDPSARYLLKTYFSDMQVSIAEAENGREGLRLVREVNPQVVFLDLKMPQMDGYEVMNILKADPETSGIPVIVMTAQVLKKAERKQLACALAILTKGVSTREEVVEKVKEAFEYSGK